MQNFDIGIIINLIRLLQSRLLITGGSGSGKSYLLRKLLEMFSGHVQQIIFDPEGEFASLREKYPFALCAVEGGDIPLSIEHAATLARKVMETKLSVIIDLYDLPADQRLIFVERFLHALMNLPKTLYNDCLVYIDEAHIFCPQSDKSKCAAEVIDLMTRGRKRGLCGIIATLRLAMLHKSAAAQCLNKMIGMTTMVIDIDRSAEELGIPRKESHVFRKLEQGQFLGIGPALPVDVGKFEVDRVITSHGQKGAGAFIPPTPQSLKEILATLSDLPSEAAREMETIEEFKREITRLKDRLKKWGEGVPTTDKEAGLITKLQISMAAAERQHNDRVITLEKKSEVQLGRISVLENTLSQILASAKNALNSQEASAVKTPARLPAAPLQPKTAAVSGKAQKQPVQTGASSLGKCARALLSFLAGFNAREFTKAQVAIATGYSVGSGGFNNALSELNSRGLIIRGDRLKANPSAMIQIIDQIGPVFQTEYSIETFKENLGKCEREIYEVLVAAPHSKYSKESLAARTSTKYSSSSGDLIRRSPD